MRKSPLREHWAFVVKYVVYATALTSIPSMTPD